MKLKNTLFLLIIACGLFAFIRFFEGRQLGTREAQERAGRVVTFDRDKIDTIYIKNAEGKVELRKGPNGRWRLEEPVKDRADSLAVSQLFTAAEALRYDGAIGDPKKGAEKEELKEYGLLNSETKVKFIGNDKPVELLFGKDAAVEGKVYVKLESSNMAYVIGKDFKEQVSRKAEEFRDRQLTDVTVAQVDKVIFKLNSGEIELGKKDEHWTLNKPLKARGNDSRIRDLISQVATAHIESFVTESASLSKFGLEEPRATISLFSEGGAAPVVLQLGANPPESKEKIYAKLSTRESVVVLPHTIDILLKTQPNDLRDRNLIRVEPDIVDRINIEGQGKEKIVLARSGESWVRKAGADTVPVNVAAAKRVLNDIRTQPVSEFIADVATDLAKYGLDQPAVKLTFSSYASENTAETKAGEKPIVAIDFGKAEGGSVYARVEDEPFIVSVPQHLMDALLTEPLQWQPLEICSNKPEEITQLEVAPFGGTPTFLERSKEGKWKLAKGDGTPNQVNVLSLVNTLASLRAVRWVGPLQPEFGFDQPMLVISATMAGKVRKITVGKNNPDNLNYAMADGLEGVFLLSKPDLSAFLLPLLERPPGSPAPADPAHPAVPPTAETPGALPPPPAPATAPAATPVPSSLPSVPPATPPGESKEGTK